MKANELMLGDWVRGTATLDQEWYGWQIAPGECIQVRSILHTGINYESNGVSPSFEDDTIRFDDIEPIPLTQEILEKNGFSFTGSGQHEMMLATPFGIAGDRYNIYVGLKKKTIEAFIAFANTESKAGWRKHNSALLEVSGPYVHELQRCLKLLGIDKEIEL